MRTNVVFRGLFWSAMATTVAVAGCNLSPPPVPPASQGSGGATAVTTGGDSGTTATGGGTATSGGSVGTSTGGVVGTQSGGSSGTQSGGMVGTGSGGDVASGGSPGTGSGGAIGAGGRANVGGATSAGGAVGTGAGGASSLKAVASAIDGLRLDDQCGTLQGGNVCLHVTNNDALPYMAMAAARLAGTTGTTYQVKLHVRGVTEPTHVQGGSTPAGAPANFNVGGNAFAAGTNEGSYEQWRITVSNPSQRYWLNAFNAVALVHQDRLLDYQVTIPIAGGATVTLDVYDGNGHLISNTAAPILAPPGVPGSMKSGQFVQLNVDDVTL